MAEEESSGLNSLLDALRAGGVDVDDIDGSDGASSDNEEAKEGAPSQDEEAAKKSRRRTARRTQPGDGKMKNPTIDVETKLGDKLASWTKRTLTIAIILAIVILLAAYWWFHPPISINSPDTWLFVGIFILAPLFLFFRVKSRTYQTGNAKTTANAGKAKQFQVLSFVPVAVVALGLIGALMSLTLFPGNAAKFANVLKVEPLDFAQDIQEVNYAEIPIIDHSSAVLLGNREMGTIADYVSQFEVDSLYSQINYKGTPVRVSPLGYADLFKWLTNRGEGIPAYALVDMTTQDAEIVRLPDGMGMKYTASEPLARNIDRYVQLKYPFYIFDEKSFEIDEDGQPWWICPVRSYTIGLFGGETISRVVLCNASTGECEDLAIEDVPQWVDRAYPAELLIAQYNWYGSYQDGWFNSWLGQAGVVQTTPGTNGMAGYNYIAKDDDVWVYTGVTSATSDSSIVGFVLVNQRTAEAHYYSVAGATEVSAMGSAEGQVQNLRYTSTFPLLINVNNQPTYFMALKDAAGLVKKFAMIDIQRYQNVAVGDTVMETQKSYETLLVTNGALTPGEDIAPDSYKNAQGNIRTMTQAVIEGNTHIYVTLEGEDGIYDFVIPSQIEIVGYQTGDDIAFSYIEASPTSPVQEIFANGASQASSTATTVSAASAPKTEPEGSTESASSASAASATTAG